MLKIKCAIVGDSSVGKSALLKSYVKQNYEVNVNEYTPTKVEKYTANVNYRGSQIVIEFIDIGGEIQSDSSRLYQGTDCFFILFNVVNTKSFESIESKWMQLLSQYRTNAVLLLIGAKCDLREDKDLLSRLTNSNLVTYETGSELAKRLSALAYMECSSLKKVGVKEIFDKAITATVLKKKSAEKVDQPDTKPAPADLSDDDKPLPSVQNLLLKEDVTIEELLTECRPEFMKEFRARNKNVINFLAKRQTLLDLLSYFSNPSKTAQEQFCACELMTAEISPILDAFSIGENALWDDLFRFFTNNKPPVPGTPSIALMNRVTCYVVNNRHLEFLQYLQGKKDLVNHVVSHIGTESVVQVLMSFIDCEMSLEKFGVPWADRFVCTSLVPLLAKKFQNPNTITDQDVSGMEDLLDNLVKKYPQSALLKKLQDGTFLDQWIQNALFETHARADSYLQVLVKIVKTSANNGDYLRNDIPPVFTKLIQEDEEPTEEMSEEQVKKLEEKRKSLDQKEKPLSRLYQLFYLPSGPLPPSISTTAGILSPLGFYRLRCVELLMELIKSNYHVLDTALMESKLIARCLDLFFQYKWNNVLHSSVEQIIRTILETKPSHLCLYLLRDCKLVDRILQAQQNEDQEKTLRALEDMWTPRTGYMGHMYSIANAIVQSSKVHYAIYYLLEDTPNRGWKKFVDGKLKQVNVDQLRPENIPVRGERKGNLRGD